MTSGDMEREREREIYGGDTMASIVIVYVAACEMCYLLIFINRTILRSSYSEEARGIERRREKARL